MKKRLIESNQRKIEFQKCKIYRVKTQLKIRGMRTVFRRTAPCEHKRWSVHQNNAKISCWCFPTLSTRKTQVLLERQKYVEIYFGKCPLLNIIKKRKKAFIESMLMKMFSIYTRIDFTSLCESLSPAVRTELERQGLRRVPSAGIYKGYNVEGGSPPVQYRMEHRSSMEICLQHF